MFWLRIVVVGSCVDGSNRSWICVYAQQCRHSTHTLIHTYTPGTTLNTCCLIHRSNACASAIGMTSSAAPWMVNTFVDCISDAASSMLVSTRSLTDCGAFADNLHHQQPQRRSCHTHTFSVNRHVRPSGCRISRCPPRRKRSKMSSPKRSVLAHAICIV